MAFKRSSVRTRLAPLILKLNNMSFSVYIIKSQKNGKYYIGQSNNPLKRLSQHNSGYSISTKTGIPWELVFIKEFTSRSDAMIYEKKLKSYKSHDYLEKIIYSNP